MNLEIVKQEYENECGICVLTTLHNYFYPNNKLSKSKVFELSNLNKDGLSIYEMEVLANKINLNIETYNINFDELVKDKLNDYFITCISELERKHFVICKITKHNVIIYETNGNIYKYSYSEFKQIYLNILISVKKTFTFNDSIYEPLSLDIKNIFVYPNEYLFTFFLIFLECILTILNVICSGFIKILIDSIIPLKMLNDLFVIALFFTISYLLSFMLNFFVSIIKHIKYEKIFKNHICIYTKILKNKNILFFNKFSKEILYEYPTALSHLIIKKYFATPLFIAETIIATFLIFLILFNSYIFIIPIVINLFLVIIFGIMKYKNNINNYEHLNVNKNKIEILYNDFLNIVINEKNYSKLNNIEQKWHKEIWTFQTFNKKNTTFEMTIDLFDNSLTRFIFICFFSYCTFTIINNNSNNKIELSTMIFLSSLLNMLTDSFSDLFSYISSLSFYKKNEIIINDFLKIHNKNYLDDGIKINSINEIKFKNYSYSFHNKKIFDSINFTFKNGDLLIGKNGVGKSTLFKTIALFYLNENKNNIYINSFNLSEINLCELDKKIIYLPNDSTFVDIDFNKIMNNDIDAKMILCKILEKTKINYKSNNLSKGETQILNIISLLDVKNKIILLDESCSNVDKSLNKLIYHDVKKHLEKNNFVLWISHNKTIHSYFNENRIHKLEQ